MANNKNQTFDNELTMVEVATPATPSTGKNKLYFKSDAKLYKLDDAGTEAEIGGSGDSAVSNKTANYTILSSDSGTIFTNAGATGAIELTLPTAAAGLNYKFVVMEAQYLRINCSSGDNAQYKDDTTATAGYFRANTAGYQLNVIAIDSTTWIVTSLDGNFTFDS